MPRKPRVRNTPRTVKKARDFAESQQGETYKFWKVPNVFANLGLYTKEGLTSHKFCFTCKSQGHVSKQCIVRAVLVLTQRAIKKNDNGEYIFGNCNQAVNALYMAVLKERWNDFLNGDNIPQQVIQTIADIDEYLKEENSPSILERQRLADSCYDKLQAEQ